MATDDPNDPALTSFVEVAADSHFPIQNLPFGIFSAGDSWETRAGVAIGDWILDLAVLERAGLLTVARADERVFAGTSLNAFIACGRTAWRDVRLAVSRLLRHDSPRLRDDARLRAEALIPQSEATLHLPVHVPGYTDFYSSKEHATNVGTMFRDPANALLPNWVHMPVAYNGRASSVVVSGTSVRRPNGQLKLPNDPVPVFGPCRKLDFELEAAFVVGTGNELGTPVPVANAEAHIFGLVLLNDWSARDIQQWEYVPLGPFNAKTFATTISPWVVTLDALAPFRVEGPAQVPEPLPYLRQSGAHAFDIALECTLVPRGGTAATLCRTNFRHLYWSMAQQLAHHTVTGCNARVGDLMASGTISGPTPDSYGSLLELAWNGTRPVSLTGGGTRTFLEDGDEVVISGYAQGEGYRVGFGEARGRIAAAARVAD